MAQKDSANSSDDTVRSDNTHSRLEDLSGAAQRVRSSLGSTVEVLRKTLYTGPLADLHIILGVSFLLSLIGAVMVLDSSGPISIARYDQYYAIFIRQMISLTLGWVGCWVMFRFPLRWLVASSGALILFCWMLLAAVHTPLGVVRNGARSWLIVGPVALQPSELAKVGLIFVLSVLLGHLGHGVPARTVLMVTLPPFAIMAGFLVAERDLGMLIVLTVTLFLAYFFSGVPAKITMHLAGIGSLGALLLIAIEGFRAERLITFFYALVGQTRDVQGSGYQSLQAKIALVSGGLTGVGLGQSRAKYNYLPEASNDFIFAIIGEETGLLGAMLVALLYLLLVWCSIRIARRVNDPTLQIFAATAGTSIGMQAFFNMWYVSGLLPVTGLQLPLISAGGSSTIVTLLTVGLLMNIAVHEPNAISYAHNTRGVRRWLLYRKDPQITSVGPITRTYVETMMRIMAGSTQPGRPGPTGQPGWVGHPGQSGQPGQTSQAGYPGYPNQRSQSPHQLPPSQVYRHPAEHTLPRVRPSAQRLRHPHQQWLTQAPPPPSGNGVPPTPPPGVRPRPASPQGARRPSWPSLWKRGRS